MAVAIDDTACTRLVLQSITSVRTVQ